MSPHPGRACDDRHWRSVSALPSLTEGEIHVWRLLRSQHPSPQEAVLLLSSDERARSARFVFERDRDPWMASRGLMRLLLAHYAGIASRDLAFVTGPHGKPVLAGSELRFNLSHTNGVAVFAVSRGIELGIDVEQVSAGEDGLLGELTDVARQNFSAREQQALLQLAPEEQLSAFYRIWTRKEALLKAEGSGLSRDLDTFTVSLDQNAPKVLDGIEGWSVAHLDVTCEAGASNSVGALAWRHQSTAPRIEFFEWTPILWRI